MPFRRKHHASPTAATSTPAIAGPRTRAVFIIEAFNAMAFMRSSRPTISTTKECLTGISKALTTPSNIDRTTISHTWMRLENVSTASGNASIIEAA